MELSTKIEKVYDWFSGFHSDAIGRALEVFNNPDTGMTIWTAKYPTLFLATAIISFLVAFVFYIWPLDHPRFKSWWSWLLMLVINCGLCLLAGWQIAHARMKEVLGRTESWEILTGKTEGVTSNDFDCLGLGLSNMMVGVLLFILFSLVLNLFSTNAKYSPFRN